MRHSIPDLALRLAALACAASLAAQQPADHGGHAERLGRVRFETSCRGAARNGVELGVAYLHSFWYEKASEIFTAAAAADSSCAMAFWGQAMTLLHPLWTPPSSADARVANGAIARGLAVSRTPRERGYLGPMRAYYADHERTHPRTRPAAYALAIDTVRRRSAAAPEAAILYAPAPTPAAQRSPAAPP